MNLDQKLKLTFDPTKIRPVMFNCETAEEETVVRQLKLFDKKLNSMYDFLQISRWESMWDLMGNSMSDEMWDPMMYSVSNSMWYSTSDPMSDSINNSIWGSMSVPLWDSIRSVIESSIGNSIYEQMYDQMWASIFVNLSKNEYESLFEDKEILKELPYDKAKELCDLYHWFSERGLFIYRSLIKGEYILASWKKPRLTQTLNIFLGVKQ